VIHGAQRERGRPATLPSVRRAAAALPLAFAGCLMKRAVATRRMALVPRSTTQH